MLIAPIRSGYTTGGMQDRATGLMRTLNRRRAQYAPSTYKATLDPAKKLKAGVRYKATVSTQAKDLADNAMAKNKAWYFKAG